MKEKLLFKDKKGQAGGMDMLRNFAIGFGVAALTVIVVIRILAGVETSLVTTESRSITNQTFNATSALGTQDLGDVQLGVVSGSLKFLNATNGSIITQHYHYTVNSLLNGTVTWYGNSTYANQSVKASYNYHQNVASGEVNATQDAVQGMSQVSDFFTVIGITMAAVVVVFFLSKVFGGSAGAA